MSSRDTQPSAESEGGAKANVTPPSRKRRRGLAGVFASNSSGGAAGSSAATNPSRPSRKSAARRLTAGLRGLSKRQTRKEVPSARSPVSDISDPQETEVDDCQIRMADVFQLVTYCRHRVLGDDERRRLSELEQRFEAGSNELSDVARSQHIARDPDGGGERRGNTCASRF